MGLMHCPENAVLILLAQGRGLATVLEPEN
jgi:hypothetical protein